MTRRVRRLSKFRRSSRVGSGGRVGPGPMGPFWALFFQLLGVARASDPPVPCGHRFSCSFNIILDILDINAKRDGYLGCTKKLPNLFLSVRYRVTRASMIWYDMV